MSDKTDNRFYRERSAANWDGDTLADAIGRELERKGFAPFGIGVPYAAAEVARRWFHGDEIAQLTSLADRLAGRIAAVEDQAASLEQLAIPEVTPSEDMRAAFRLAARGLRAALSECGHPNHGAADHDCAPFGAPPFHFDVPSADQSTPPAVPDCTAVGFGGEGRCIEPAASDGLCVTHARQAQR